MLEQTKTAVERLKAAGLKRKEFAARCEVRRFTYKDQSGANRQMTEYGDVSINLWPSLERQLALVPALLANGLNVTMFRKKDGTYSYPLVSVAIGNTGKKEEIQL